MVYRYKPSRVSFKPAAKRQYLARTPMVRKIQAKNFNQRVKKIISRQEETKFKQVDLADFRPGARRFYMFQPLANIIKGTDDSQRVGSEIRNVNLRMSITWTCFGNNSLNDTRLTTGVPLRVMLIRSVRDLTVGKTAWTQISTAARSTTAELPLFFNQVQTVNALPDLESDVKIVKQFWLSSHQPTTSLIAGDTVFKMFNYLIPSYKYQDETTTPVGRRSNYYIVVTTSGTDVISDNSTNGAIQFHCTMTYKDS